MATATETLPARPFVFVIEDEPAVYNVVKRTFDLSAVDAEYFDTAKEAVAALDLCHPQRILLDLVLRQSDAIDVIHGLAEKQYRGVVHMMSGSRLYLIDAVQRMGASRGLVFGEPLNKPFRLDALLRVVSADVPNLTWRL